MFGPLLTDLYQLTMLQAYFDRGMDRPASFELFVRKLPAGRNFLLAAGLEQVLQYLEQLRFEPPDLAWLAQTGRFSAPFLRALATLRFTGDVWAMPEGTVFFPAEPILRITAPLGQAQLAESRVINLLHYQSLVASKAARCVLAAPQRLLIDFGLRRAHGGEAGLLSARASYLAGFAGTATVQAGRDFGIPLYGTMAHSYVQAFDDEAAAFAHFVRSQPGNATLLIDTYDTEAAARKVVRLAAGLAGGPAAIHAVRLDSGDLGLHARRVRAILDAGGLAGVRILASGNLDEHRLRELVDGGAPIDGFGVGTRMNTSADAAYLDCAYKLTEYDGIGRRKQSEGKATWPGRKQVLRRAAGDGRFVGDLLTLEGDGAGGAAPLLQQVMAGGVRTGAAPTLDASRELARRQVAALPPALRALEPAPPYPVAVSDSLAALARAVDERLGLAAEAAETQGA
ncbi:nicotinate phosphoribosyltransferase [Ramlibacter sp.]|uniref:nicotinate phosphoribosyltransferase n=1 Tax=Ramlibacter sp. TaxID=1917967 RepID=UPI002B63259D|nr:nicotinate phosphoribosyltransferase [Ramlibacter sp.]HWI81136.1 nicotinate phosphoribosyltransferase [Ramlibacter sp.]